MLRIKRVLVSFLTMALAVTGLVAAFQPASAGAATLPTLSVPDKVVGESDGAVTIPVTLSAPSASTVTVGASFGNSTTNNLDYAVTNTAVTFAPGQTTQNVVATITNDLAVEGIESFTLNLSSPTGATIAKAVGRISIIDNDTVVTTPKLFVRDALVDEKTGLASVPVLLGGTGGQASASTVTVTYATANAEATAGSDFTTTTGTLTFNPGQTAKTIQIPITDDTTAEGNERFKLNLGTPVNATIGDGTGVITIGANDAPAVATPTISVAEAVIGEADGYLDVPVTLSAPGTNPVSVGASFGNSTTNNLDYAVTNSAVTFAPGQTTKTIRVEIVNDAAVEGIESFTLNLSSPTGATIAKAVGRISIIDNDTVVTTPKLFVRDALVDEKTGLASVPVLLGGTGGQASASTVTVTYATANAEATAGSDFTTTTGTLTFNPGQTAKTIQIPITDDTTAEGNERFKLNLGTPVNATIGDGTGVITIGANDAPAVATPTISVAEAVIGEADGYLDVPVTLSAPGTNPVSVGASFGNSTTNNLDYAVTNSAVTFAPGQTTKTIRVEIVNDAAVEGIESFTLNLSSPTGATIAKAVGRISIIDNDTVVTTPKLFVRDALVDEKTGLASVPVLLGGTGGQASASTVTVTYATANAEATAGSDFTTTTGTLTFNPGQTAKTIQIPITDDTTAEGNERFKLNLGTPVNATIGDGTGVITIGANDAPAVATPTISVAEAVIGEADGYLDVPVTLSAPGTNPVSVGASFGNSTTNNLDYAVTNTAVTFAPGQTTKTIRVEIVNDAAVEGIESFTLNLSSPTGATIAKAVGRISIIDNDTAGVNVSYTTSYTATEVPRLLQSASYLGLTPEAYQKQAVAIVSYLLGTADPAVAASLITIASTGPTAYTTSWTSADISALWVVQAQYGLATPEQAQKYAANIISYLLSLQGN